MTKPERARWEDAILALFGGLAFAAVGAREHEDWRRDAVDVMRVRSADPRGWKSINSAPDGDVWTVCGPEMPFLPPSLEDFDSVFPVSSRSAAQILVTLQGESFYEGNIPHFDDRKEELLEHAAVILERFGQGAACYTNAGAARENPDADMFAREGEYECFTDYTMDCGVIAVSDSEVGVFWAFMID
ncbi:hypothetical protein [Streptomyces luteolus]|uniref:Uncharacterized protein n=1 Tax=Streptomyces luteolus TaxID=3043615 RepID=A0ABT6SRE4_9ACTN|nr:hypothetical protein [Streptomyces sp. B-S-A12]MDI3417935.1 hypothetical protein [Streptomyces sp. B-S-A12]